MDFLSLKPRTEADGPGYGIKANRFTYASFGPPSKHTKSENRKQRARCSWNRGRQENPSEAAVEGASRHVVPCKICRVLHFLAFCVELKSAAAQAILKLRPSGSASCGLKREQGIKLATITRSRML